MDADLLQMLDEAQLNLAGIPFPLSSAYRCPKHNKAVGGVPTSAHTRGYAVDIRCVDSIPVSSCCKPCLRPDSGASSWPRRGFVDNDPDKPRDVAFYSMEASTDGSDRD